MIAQFGERGIRLFGNQATQPSLLFLVEPRLSSPRRWPRFKAPRCSMEIANVLNPSDANAIKGRNLFQGILPGCVRVEGPFPEID
jgi:hypothetical protein